MEAALAEPSPKSLHSMSVSSAPRDVSPRLRRSRALQVQGRAHDIGRASSPTGAAWGTSWELLFARRSHATTHLRPAAAEGHRQPA